MSKSAHRLLSAIRLFYSEVSRPSWASYLWVLLIALLVYFNSCGSSFADDSCALICDFMQQGWAGFWGSYQFVSIYWLHDLFSNLMWQSFGPNNHVWFIVIFWFFATGCFYLFHYFRLVLEAIEVPYSLEIAWGSILLFMSSPYHIENLFWIATYHYAICFCYLAWALYHLAMSAGRPTIKLQIILFLPFFPMLTMHEISLVFPFLFLFTLLYFCKYHIKQGVNGFLPIFYTLVPYGLASLLLLGLTKLIRGSFLPHYGQVHIEGHTLSKYLETLYQYTAQYLLHFDFFAFDIRQKFYDVSPTTISILYLALGVSVVVLLYRKRHQMIRYRYLMLAMSFLMILFVPVANMYFMWHFVIINDRLGFYLFIPLSWLIVCLLYELLGGRARYILLLMIALQLILLRSRIARFPQINHYLEHTLVDTYRPYLHQRPILLNLPNYYLNFYGFRKDFRFTNFIQFNYGIRAPFIYVGGMAYMSTSDSVQALRLNDSTIEMNCHSAGGWLMRSDLGMVNYSDSLIKISTYDSQHATITLAPSIRNQPVLYTTGDRGFVRLAR